jgi:HSP20 family protein
VVRYRHLTLRLVHPVPVVPAGAFGWPGGRVALSAPARWRPPVDMCETGDMVIIAIEVAGLLEDQTDIALYEDGLVVDGERLVEACGPDGRYHVAEIRQGSFHVEIVLPTAVDAEAVSATYDGGLLRIDLPKRLPGRTLDRGPASEAAP